MMKLSRYRKAILSFICLFILIISCQSLGCSRTPDVKIYTFPPQSDSPSPTPTPGQPQDLPASPPTTSEPQQNYAERRIVVDERNNVFSIGVPSNTKETTEVIAEKPIDFWFEYLPDDLQLEVDGAVVPRSSHWELKLRYTTGVTKFKYVITNSTPTFYSYNLHLLPTKAGDSVSVTVRQRWSGL